MKWIEDNSLYFAWLISLSGLLISLFTGELLRIEPCHLCWYQRIALFPLSIILGMAVYRNEIKIVPYVLPLVAIGSLIALYQVIGQKFPFLFSASTCGLVDECANPVFKLFGFLTFPLLSFFGFILIGGFLFVSINRSVSLPRDKF